MPSVTASESIGNFPTNSKMDALSKMEQEDNPVPTGTYPSALRQPTAADQQQPSSRKSKLELVPFDDLDDDIADEEEDGDPSGTEKGHLAIPEIIETLKNLAACKEKLFKWEQSVANLESIPDSDPNKSHLMEIIGCVENTKTSTKEKAIYLYEQLGMKCRQHKNYIGAAKAFERAASLRLDISDLNESGDNREAIVTSTIRYLESAIHNYDAIHKFKHAGTLHYRCSRILKMMNASHEEVDKHHEKALEYFTKPDHELKHRKRIDGLKISCYSSYSTLARMHHEIEKFHHTTTTTTMTNTIKFHADGCYRDSDDSDSNHSTTPPPSSSGSAMGSNPVTPVIPFYGEDRHEYHHNGSDFFDSFMADSLFDEPPAESRPAGQTGDAHATESTNGAPVNGPGSSAPSGGPANGTVTSMTKSAMMEKSSSSSKSSNATGNRVHQHNSSSSHHFAHHESVKDHHHHYHQHLAKSASSSHHRQHHTGAGNTSYSFQKHHKATAATLSTINSPLSAALHASQLHKTTFRCIEDRIESARKLVKKLHKLCPFYEVSTNGDDAGRVYCRICDRYLGAVSSTLKNHINTQEHRQAYEDSQLPPSAGAITGPGGATVNGTQSALPALPAPPTLSAPATNTPNGAPSSYPPNTNLSTVTSREDLGNGVGYANTKPNYSNSASLPLASPFMLQPAYQPSIQNIDSALQKSHLSGKYMDFDQGEQQPNMGSWQTANQANNGNTSYGGEPPNQQAPSAGSQQQYLFASSNANTNGMAINNLLTFTDAMMNVGGSSVAATSSKQQQQQQAMAAAVLMQQSNLGPPHYAIPSSVALSNGLPNSGLQVGNGNGGGAGQGMPVLTYQ